MIYNREESEVAVLGDVQKFKVGIDAKNINHIVTILSSNLYSHPMESFLRETISNAIDSHIEAEVNEPIILCRKDNNLSIRDFGTGISPERFQEIFLNIGSSTKRDSNDYIGSFGIGRFSCLSVSDLANITSFYNGKAYYYVMNKDVDQLHIDLIFEKDTDEKNGVEVKIPISYFDIKALRGLVFIDNLFVDTDNPGELFYVREFNKRKIYSFKNFKTTSYIDIHRSYNILLGKIPYTVDWASVLDVNSNEWKEWKEAFGWIYPQIEIGQVDITPNREALLYSERTKAVLRRVFNACIEELTQMYAEQCKIEITNLYEYILEIKNHSYNSLKLEIGNIPLSPKLPYNISYSKYKNWDSVDYEDRKNIITKIIYDSDLCEILAVFDGQTLSSKQRYAWYTPLRIMDKWLSQNAKTLVLPSRTGFSSTYFKNFLSENYNDTVVLLKYMVFSRRKYRTYLKSFGPAVLNNNKAVRFITQFCKELLKYFNDRVTITDIIGSQEYDKFKKNNQIKKERINTQNIQFTLTFVGRDNSYNKTVSKKVNEIIPYIKKCSEYDEVKRVVYTTVSNPFIRPFCMMHYPGLLIIAVAEGRLKLLQNYLPKWVTPIEELYKEDNKVLRRIATLSYIRKDEDCYILNSDYELPFPEPIREMFKELRNLYSLYPSSSDSYEVKQILSIIPEEKYDKNILSLFKILKPYMRIEREVSLLNINKKYPYYMLMKNKRLRLNYKFYKEIKELNRSIMKI